MLRYVMVYDGGRLRFEGRREYELTHQHHTAIIYFGVAEQEKGIRPDTRSLMWHTFYTGWWVNIMDLSAVYLVLAARQRKILFGCDLWISFIKSI